MSRLLLPENFKFIIFLKCVLVYLQHELLYSKLILVVFPVTAFADNMPSHSVANESLYNVVCQQGAVFEKTYRYFR